MWQVQWDSRAESDAAKLDIQIRQRVTTGIKRFAETGRGNLRKLQGRQDQWRLRVGDWRVILTLDYSVRILTILRVQHRSQAYQ